MHDWIEIIVNAITSFIEQAGYGGVFLLMMLEACCMPIPSEVILSGAGFLVGQQQFYLPYALASAIGGALTGSTITYSLGRFGGRLLVVRFGRYILLTDARLAATEQWFAKHGPKAVFLCRWITGMRAIVSIPAGLCHMPYGRFLIYTALGSGTWAVVGILFGLLVGREWERLSHIGHYILAAAVILVAGLLVFHHFHKKHGKV